jgi:hypothetical protein
MNKNAERMIARALKTVKLHGNFSPAAIGKRIGLSRTESELAARALSNAGVLVLGFDYDAQFSPEFRRARGSAPAEAKKRRRPTAADVDPKPVN